MDTSGKMVMILSLCLIVLPSWASGSRTKRTIAELDQLDPARFFHLDGDFSDTLETELDNAQWRRQTQSKSKREAPEAEAVKEENVADPCSASIKEPTSIKRRASRLPLASRVVALASSKKLAIPPKFSRM